MLKKRFSINIQYGMILCLLFLAAINFDAKFYYFALCAREQAFIVSEKNSRVQVAKIMNLICR